MRKIFKKKQQKGSVLIFTLIISAIIFMTVSAYIYSSRINLFSSKSLTENSQKNLLHDSYIDFYIPKIKTDIESFSINDTTSIIDKSEPSQIFYNYNNIKQYESEALNSYNIDYKIYDNSNNLINSKKILFNQPIDGVFYDYSGNKIPISVPYINLNNLTESEENYRLYWDKSLINTEQGYVGYFELGATSNKLNLIVDGVTRVIDLPIDVTDSHEITIGWDLKYGRWYLHLAIFNSDYIYIVETSLDSILDKYGSDAVTDLEDTQELQIMDDTSGDILDVKFINDVVNGNAYTPSILIFRATDSGIYYDDVYSHTERYHSLYKSNYIGNGYNNPTQIIDKLEGEGISYTYLADATGISNSEILYSLAIVDTNSSLSDEKAVIIMKPTADWEDYWSGNGDSKSFVYDIINNEVTELIDPIIISEGNSLERPINIIKKDDNSFYIETFEGKNIHRYLYTDGLSNLETSEDIYNEYIRAVIPKYGYSFIITDTDHWISSDYYKLYQYDYANEEILQEINLTQEPINNQIFYDEINNEFYVQKYGLENFLDSNYGNYSKDIISQDYLSGFGVVHIL